MLSLWLKPPRYEWMYPKVAFPSEKGLGLEEWAYSEPGFCVASADTLLLGHSILSNP